MRNQAITQQFSFSEFVFSSNAEVEKRSARLRRASSGVAPEPSSHHLSAICGGKRFVGQGFRRDAENHTPEACDPRMAKLRPVPISEFVFSPNSEAGTRDSSSGILPE
jgi:hypothetical protein